MTSRSLSTSLFLALSLLLASSAVKAAVVTLYIPAIDTMALSADVLGTDGAGRTTWRLSPGQASGTLTAVSDFPTATLVEGPNDAHLEAHDSADDDVDYRVDCAIKDGVSDCTWVAINASTTTTLFAGVTETVSAQAFAVQVTGTGVPAAKNAVVRGRAVGSSLVVAAAAMVLGIVLCAV